MQLGIDIRNLKNKLWNSNGNRRIANYMDYEAYIIYSKNSQIFINKSKINMALHYGR